MTFPLQFDEQKDHVTVERILRVVFLDVERPSPVSNFMAMFFVDNILICTIMFNNDYEVVSF